METYPETKEPWQGELRWIDDVLLTISFTRVQSKCLCFASSRCVERPTYPISWSKLMKLIRWYNPDAYYNLAAEEYIFTSLDREQEYLLLWQNQNAVVVGKHQNTSVQLVSTKNQPICGGQFLVYRMTGSGKSVTLNLDMARCDS